MNQLTRSPFRTHIFLFSIALLTSVSWFGLQACSISATDLVTVVDRRPLLKSLRDTILIPYSEQFVVKAMALEASAVKLAAQPDLQLLEKTQAAWKEAALAWAILQAIRLGPISDQTLRLNFWPTRPNLIEQVLMSSVVLDSNRLSDFTASAAKGLPAVEWLLFSQPSDSVLAAFKISPVGPRRSEYIVALTADIRRIAVLILSEWQGKTGNALVEPGVGLRYPTTQMAVEELLKGLISTLEEMKNNKVLTPAGTKSEGRVQPDAVEAPYANYSLEILSANLEGVQSTFTGQGSISHGTGLNVYLEELGSVLPAHLVEAFNQARIALSAVPKPLSTAVVSQASKVVALGSALTNLVVIVKNDVASTLGINITFTDNDGD